VSITIYYSFFKEYHYQPSTPDISFFATPGILSHRHGKIESRTTALVTRPTFQTLAALLSLHSRSNPPFRLFSSSPNINVPTILQVIITLSASVPAVPCFNPSRRAAVITRFLYSYSRSIKFKKRKYQNKSSYYHQANEFFGSSPRIPRILDVVRGEGLCKSIR